MQRFSFFRLIGKLLIGLGLLTAIASAAAIPLSFAFGEQQWQVFALCGALGIAVGFGITCVGDALAPTKSGDDRASKADRSGRLSGLPVRSQRN